MKVDTSVVEWLAYCRRERKDLSDAEFEALVPKFIALRRRLLREMRTNERLQRAH